MTGLTLGRTYAILWVSIFFSFAPIFTSSAEGKPIDPAEWYKIEESVLKANPDSISEAQFYDYEFAIFVGYRHYLDDPQINWIQRVEAALTKKGIRLKDEWNRGFVIADSYINLGQYEKALEEFKKLKQQDGIELAEWLVKNESIKKGKVSITEYPGSIPNERCGEPKVEDERYVFECCFKGPIYRYDKVANKHAIIYMPEFKYDWCDKLAFDGKIVTITLRGGAGVFQYNNESAHIGQVRERKE